MATVAATDDVRVLVITGAGTAFCAGADLAATFGGPPRPVAELRRHLHAIYDSFLRVRDLPIPTIAAVNGPAVGAGANLALSCDLRVADRTATLGFTFTRLGLHPGGGASYFLTRQVGPQRALAMLLDGATLSAEEALARGLVLEVAEDPVARALSLADGYATLDRDLVRDLVHTVRMAVETDLATIAAFESWAQASSATKPEIRSAIQRLKHPRR